MASGRKKRRFGKIAIVAGAVLFIALVLTMLARVEPIEVVSSRLEQSGGTVFVEGTVKNTGTASAAVSLQVRYFDAGGRKLAQDEVKLAGLDGGAEAKFRSPARELDGVKEFSILIDHGPNPYGN